MEIRNAATPKLRLTHPTTGSGFHAAVLSVFLFISLGLPGHVHASEARQSSEKSSDPQVIKVPRYKPKPGISESLPSVHKLPNKLVIQKPSPDRKFVAQVMVAKPGPAYYLAIVDRKRMRRFYIDEHLITGTEYRYKDIRMFWKTDNTVVIEARHSSGKKVLWLEYNNKTAKITRGEMPVPDLTKSRPKPRKKLAPESLTTIRLDTLEERMMLHKQIPMGVTYNALKKNMPGLGPLKKEVAGGGLTEAFLEIEVLGYQARVEFNFKDKVLYGYGYHLPNMKPEQAKVAYKKLQDFYSKHFGQYKEHNMQEEPGYAVRQSIWKTDKGTANVVNNISYNGVRIVWKTEF